VLESLIVTRVIHLVPEIVVRPIRRFVSPEWTPVSHGARHSRLVRIITRMVIARTVPSETSVESGIDIELRCPKHFLVRGSLRYRRIEEGPIVRRQSSRTTHCIDYFSGQVNH